MASHAHLCCLCGCPVAYVYKHIQEFEELEGFNSLRHGDETWFKWGVALFSNMMSYPGRIEGDHVLLVDEVYEGDIPKPGATYDHDLPDFDDAAEDSDEDTPVGPFSTSGDAEYTGLDYFSGSAVIVHHRCLSLAVQWTNSGSINEFFMSPAGSILAWLITSATRNISNRRSKEALVAAVDWYGSLSVDYEAFKTGRDWPRWMDDHDYRPDNAWLLTRPDRFPELPLVTTKCLPGAQRQQHCSDNLGRLPMEIVLAILDLLVGDERTLLRLQSTSHFWRSFLLGDTGLLQALYRKRCIALAWVPTLVDINRRAKQFDAVLDAEPGTIDWKSYYISCSRSPSMRNRNRMYRKMWDVYHLIHGGEGRRKVYNAHVKWMWVRGYGEEQIQMI
ncbi:hypothetical protein SpCBS45565_g04534 [Spizellomyces sp. 'palustris']|nr:hypothetical protein SpCBS45565_g04534 [Spizellomyces sp. 'palustris']